MAENVGKITVAIEAQTEALQQGLQQAEILVKQSASKIEAEQKTLTNKIGKSWTELSSKLNVISTVANVAMKAWNTLDGVLSVVTDSTLNASQKITGSMDSIQNAGIPIVSQFLAIGRGIYDWVSGEKALRREIDRNTAAIEQRAAAALKAFNARKAQRDELTGMTSTMLTLLENEEMLARETTEAGKAQLTQTKERAALQEAFDKRMEALKDKATQAFLAEEAYKFKMAMGYLDQKHSRELEAAKERDAANEAAHQAEIARVQKETQAKAEAAAREAKMVEDTTQGLRDTLAQLTAEAAGDELGAQMIALEAKFRKMREGATGDQLELIAKIEKAEKARLQKSTEMTGGGGGGQTASISTAIGSFTVAMAGDPIQKEQTSLLKRIADSNEKVADALSKKSNESIIVPA